MATLRLATAQKKGEILPVVPRALGDGGGGGGGSSGGGDGGGSSAPSAPSAPSGGGDGGGGGYVGPGDGGGSYSQPAFGPGGWYTNVQAARAQGNSASSGEGPDGGGIRAYTAPTPGRPSTPEQPQQPAGSGGGGSMRGRIVGPAELQSASNRAIAEDDAAAARARATESYYNPRTVRPLTLEQARVRQIEMETGLAQAAFQQKLMQSQVGPPSGFGGGGDGFSRGRGAGGGGGTGGYYTGLVPPGTGGGQLEIPVYDQDRVEALAQRAAAPGIRKLRDQVQQVQGSNSENPNVKAMTLRQALAGYGSGLESVMGGALIAGAGMYGKEYDPTVAAATTNYRGNLERELQAERLATQERISAAGIAAGKENQYQNAWNEWNNVWK